MVSQFTAYSFLQTLFEQPLFAPPITERACAGNLKLCTSGSIGGRCSCPCKGCSPCSPPRPRRCRTRLAGRSAHHAACHTLASRLSGNAGLPSSSRAPATFVAQMGDAARRTPPAHRVVSAVSMSGSPAASSASAARRRLLVLTPVATTRGLSFPGRRSTTHSPLPASLLPPAATTEPLCAQVLLLLLAVGIAVLVVAAAAASRVLAVCHRGLSPVQSARYASGVSVGAHAARSHEKRLRLPSLYPLLPAAG